MEKLKNILSPGKATDDEIMYGSGRSNDPVHSGNTGTLAGEGSHFDNSRDTPSGMGLGSSHIGNALTTAGPHSTDLANKADPRVDSDLDGSRTAGNTTGAYGSTGQSSMPGAFESHSNPYSTQEIDPRLGAPTTTSGLGSNTTGTGYNTIGQSGITGQSTTGNTDSHLGRDAATVGTAGAVGEGIHHHREKERENLGTSAGVSGTGYRDNTGIGNTTSNTTTGPHSSSLLNKLDPRVDSNSSGTVDNTGSDRHYGRDAAVGAGGVGLAEHEHRKHERERETGVGSTTGTGIGSNTGAYSEDLAYTGTTGSADHHYGRDAAVGAGGVGLAEHERRKHERERETGVGSSTGLGSNTGAYGDDPNYTGTTGVTGHHYGRDAAVGASGVGLAEHEHRKHEREREAGVDSNTGIGSTAGAYRDDPSYTGTAGDSGHHYGRDAALGAGGVGLAEHEHRKHERERESGLGGTTGTTAGTASGTGPAPNTAGPHSKDWMNKLDPRVKSNPDAADTGLSGTCGTTHGERDAVAGAGLAGAGGYEAEKHHAVRNEPGVGGTHDESLPNLHHTGRDASAIGAATALDENEKARLRAARGERDNNYNQGPVEPGYGSATTGPMSDQGPYDPGYNPTTTGPMHEQSRDHHLGRDAAGAGVIGDAAYEADKHYKHDKDLTAAEREQKRELKHEEKEAKREQKEEKKHHGLLGFLHRDKNKKYTKEEEEEFDRQEREHNRHTGRDAAIGGAAVGGAAYEAEKHHGHHHTSSGELDTMKPLPVAPGNNGIGTGDGTQNALVTDRKRGEGYDMASTTGTGIGTGTGHPLAAGTDAYQPPRTTLGDKLHDVERNRGVNDGMTGAGYDTTTGTTGTGTHHLGRDAAVGAGGVGLAEHEHRKHEEERGTGVGGTYPTATGTTGTPSGIGYGAGDPVTSMLGTNTETERSAGYSAPTAAKHNVLHKDPPANHSATRGMTGEGTYPQDTTGTGNY